MRAMKERIGIKYACNHDNKGDLMWMQSQIRNGPCMVAISPKRDQICLQSSFDNFARFVQNIHYHVTLGPLSTLQAYLVPLEEIAAIHGPFRIWDCKHLVPFKTEIASILGPLYYHDCKYI